jgi:hypothetical protein
MSTIYAQGDILIERVSEVLCCGALIDRDADGALVLARGETTGHRHAVFDRVMMFRDDNLARDVPAELYVGHLRVDEDEVLLRHEEHAPITLPRGTYLVRRQRELEPREAGIVAD